MYREHFNLKELPFSIAPNPRYLFLTHQHQEALAHLIYGLNSAGGIILLTGEVGTGKTTISRKLLEDLPDNIDIAWIVNPRLSVEELLAAICDELRIKYSEDTTSIKIFTDLISNRLIQAHGRNHNVVLMIDEAQNLSPEVLEQLRLLTNLETSERKLLQIILLGQPELKTMLERTDLRQLAQRITARYHLQPLSRVETGNYIRHRLSVGGCIRPVFSPRAMKLIHHISHGTPRLINLLCDRAMLGVYSAGKSMVYPKHVRQASAEVLGKADLPKRHYLFPVIAMLLLAAAGAVFATGSWQQLVNTLHIKTEFNVADNSESKKTPPRPATEHEQTGIAAHMKVDAKASSSHAPITVANHLPEYVPSEMPAATALPHKSTNNTVLLLEEDIPRHTPTATHQHSVAASQAEPWTTIQKKGSKTLAMQTLAGIWNAKLEIVTGDPCQQLTKNNLFCLPERADIHRLQALDRPAMFEISGSSGGTRHAVIHSIANDHAIIQLGTQQWVIKLVALKKQWQNKITLIWNKPPGYSEKLQQGDRGLTVEWLAKQLDQIQGTMIPPRPFHSMDAIMVERLKDFQKSEHINPDGIAGILTLMRINERIGLNTPKLIRMAQH